MREVSLSSQYMNPGGRKSHIWGTEEDITVSTSDKDRTKRGERVCTNTVYVTNPATPREECTFPWFEKGVDPSSPKSPRLSLLSPQVNILYTYINIYNGRIQRGFYFPYYLLISKLNSPKHSHSTTRMRLNNPDVEKCTYEDCIIAFVRL